MEKFIDKMKNSGVRDLAIKIFQHNFSKLLKGNLGFLPSSEIEPVDSPHEKLHPEHNHHLGISELVEISKKVCVIKLNGGLGTGMGLNGPKSQIVVKNNLNFLEISTKQIEHFRNKYRVQVPLIYFNSFSTQKETLANLDEMKFSNFGLDNFVIENKNPKISKLDGVFVPANYELNPELEWAPPGHADIYPTLFETGLLDELISRGFEYLYISNIDNLGAVLNLAVLEKVVSLDSSFVMEVAQRTEMDKKGGHLAFLKGRLTLRESAQVLPEDIVDFQNFVKYSQFNTNSIWIKTKVLKKVLEDHNGILDLPIIINEKNVNPTDEASEKIIQLETAMGSAITYFPDAKLLLVPDFRFLPVKNTAQLLYLMSDAVLLTEDLLLLPQSKFPIHLESKYYKNMSDFSDRFACIPSLKNCLSLKIKSDITFSKPAVLEGHVEI